MKKVSICGKGGSGKSVIVTLMARVLVEEGYTVLTVDSDESNPGLYRMFGFDSPSRPVVDVDRSQAYLAAVFQEDAIGIDDIPKEYLNEEGNLKLMVIGKIVQALEGCACVMGSIVKDFMRKLVLEENEIALVDTEAGVEHFGRGLEQFIDTVMLLVEPSFESFALADKARGLATGMGVPINVWAVLNKIPSREVENDLRERLARRNIEVAGVIYYDPQIQHDCLIGEKLSNSQAKLDVAKMVQFIFSSRPASGDVTSTSM